MRLRLTSVPLILLVLGLAACQPATRTAAPVTKLTFTYWGSDMEKAAIASMAAAFEAANHDVDVQAIQIPYEEYLAQVTAMMKQGRSPDVGYFPGLQPLQKSYYTAPDKMKLWLDNAVHPAEAKPTFTDYIANYSRPLPSYYLRNYAAVLDAAIRPALDKIWNNQATAAEALKEAVQAAGPLMQGRWDR